MSDSYKVGDIIIINNSKLKTNGKIGKIIKVLDNNLYKVEFENKNDYIETINCKGSSIKLHKSNAQININKDYKKEGNVLKLRFIGNKFKPYKSEYLFKNYDNNIKENDYVLCYTSIGLRIGFVVEIMSNLAAYSNFGYWPKKDIICKVDIENYIKDHGLNIDDYY